MDVSTQIDLIVASDNGLALSTDILNSADTLTTKKLKKTETEQLLKRLVQDKWLCEVNTAPRSNKDVIKLQMFLNIFDTTRGTLGICFAQSLYYYTTRC